MDFGEHIRLDDDEYNALKFAGAGFQRVWPANEQAFHELERLILDRIMDKQSVLDAMRESGELRHSVPDAFRLRRHLGTLSTAHNQLFAYALEQGFDTSPPEVE